MLDAATTIVPTAWARPDRARDVNSHRQLMAAVLQTAIDDCWDSFCARSAGYGTLAAGRRFREARVYMLSKDRVGRSASRTSAINSTWTSASYGGRSCGHPWLPPCARPAPSRSNVSSIGAGVASFLGLKFTETEYEWNKANARWRTKAHHLRRSP